jgi:hypothetical protein
VNSKNWLGIQIELDNYQGWISKGQIRIISEEDFNHFKALPQWISNDLVQILENQSRKLSILVSAGSTFYNCSDNSFRVVGDQYIYHGQLFKPDRFDKDQLAQGCLNVSECSISVGRKVSIRNRLLRFYTDGI